MLNPQRLRLLRELASRKTIAAVAESFFMTPSAVSQQLALLERETGTDLIEKSGRGVRLTAVGARLVENSEEIFAAIERAEGELIDTSHGISGELRISAFPTGARAIIVRAVAQLKERHPNLIIIVEDFEPEVSLPMLSSGELDLVLYYEWNILPSLPMPGIKTYQLLSENVYLGLPPNHPAAQEPGKVAFAAIEGEDWIAGREATSMLELIGAAAAHAGITPQATFHSMDFEVILSAVEAGLGVALIPSLAFLGKSHNVSYKTIADVDLHRTVRVALRKGSEYNPLITTTLSAIFSAAKEVEEELRLVTH